MASAEAIFARWNEAGWLVNNCFQLSAGRWQVNVRSQDEEKFAAFGVGSSIESAFADLLRRNGWASIPDRNGDMDMAAVEAAIAGL